MLDSTVKGETRKKLAGNGNKTAGKTAATRREGMERLKLSHARSKEGNDKAGGSSLPLFAGDVAATDRRREGDNNRWRSLVATGAQKTKNK